MGRIDVLMGLHDSNDLVEGEQNVQAVKKDQVAAANIDVWDEAFAHIENR